MPFLAALAKDELIELNDSMIWSIFFDEIIELKRFILLFILLRNDLLTLFLFNDCLFRFFADL